MEQTLLLTSSIKSLLENNVIHLSGPVPVWGYADTDTVVTFLERYPVGKHPMANQLGKLIDQEYLLPDGRTIYAVFDIFYEERLGNYDQLCLQVYPWWRYDIDMFLLVEEILDEEQEAQLGEGKCRFIVKKEFLAKKLEGRPYQKTNNRGKNNPRPFEYID